MKTPSTKNKRTKDNKGETNGDDSYMSESNVVDDLPLAKSNDDQHFVKGNKSEDGEQGKKKNKKKKRSEHKEYKEFKSNECEDDNKGKKMKKKQKLIEGNTLKECNDFRSNGGEEGEHGEQDKKMKKKKKKLSEESKHKEYSEFKSNECEDDQGKKMKKKQKLIEGNTLNECNDFRSHGGEVGEQDKKMKKKKKKLSEESKHKEYSEFKSNECEDVGHGKKMKKKQKLIEGNTLNECNDFRSNGGEDGEQDKKIKKKQLSEESKHKEYREFKSNECEDDGRGKKMKKLIKEGKNKEYNDIISNEGGDGEQCKDKNKPSNKRKSKENNDQVKKKKKKEAKAVTSESPNYAHNESPNLEPNGPRKPKRVSFRGEEDLFCCNGLVRGKRFTPEEDEKIKEAVFDFIDSHGLGDDGLAKILQSNSHAETRGCWKTITCALPHRPAVSVYMRAHTILERIEGVRWKPDELEFIFKTRKEHGPNSYGMIAEALGKSRQQVREAWRRLSFENTKRGHWSQEEYQTLFNLVNLDLRKRSLEPYRKSQHGMLRDNISWEAIGHTLGTRDSSKVCIKWYDQLTSPMVTSGDWCDTDDFRLINALYTLDACCTEEVEWDELLEHRSGDICRKRWDQMVQHIGEHSRKSFIEQVEILTKRYCPDLLEAREAFDSKPVIC
ncbi:hypothetical protein TSUD_15570 [Trifolium subterraneum]|uniref:Myb-like domain-containing protein n=1 Tax=Trifolium subterraneum TaxID=3900 RepID=A0A2Z6MGE4_TRISU|nr:hypothetical protein TSUD_15570 [Trifolium subterraneum]